MKTTKFPWRRRAGHPNPTPPPETLTYTGTPPPIVTVGETYSFDGVVQGGTAPMVFSHPAGNFVPGVGQDTETGHVGGLVTDAATESGNVLRVTDSGNPPQVAEIGPFTMQSVSPAPPPDLTIPMQIGYPAWVDISAWRATLPFENTVDLTVIGPVTFNNRERYFSVQTSGQTFSYATNELGAIYADASAADPEDTCYWQFSAHTGAGNTGAISIFTVVFEPQETPILTVDVSSLVYAGMGGAMLSRWGPGDDDWTITTQSTPNAFKVWDNEAVAWNGASYLSATLTVGEPDVGDAAYTVTVSSPSRGVLATYIFNVHDDFVDYRPSPTQDKTTTPFDQMCKLMISGDRLGARVYGRRAVSREGDYNPTSTSFTVNPGVPTSGSAPASPFGTNAAPSWDEEDGWNPNWFLWESEIPYAAHVHRMRIKVTALPGKVLAYRFFGFDLNKTSAATGSTIYVFDTNTNTGTAGTHYVAFDHCFNPQIGTSEGDYNTNWLTIRNWFDKALAHSTASLTIGINGQDCQRIGNIWLNMVGDINNGFTYCSAVGNGKNKKNFNVSVHKKLAYESHSDFSQPSGVVNSPKYRSTILTPPGTKIDLGEEVGNLCLKGQGYKYTADDIGYCTVYFQSETVTGSFAVGDTLTGASGRTAVVRLKVDARELQIQLTDATLPFTIGEYITASPSGATGVTNDTIGLTGVTGPGFAVGDVLQNAALTKTAQVLKVNSATSLNLMVLTGTPFSNGEVLTAISGSGTGTSGTKTSASSSAITTWSGGMPLPANLGQTIGDCQGWFAHTASPVPTEGYRNDLIHTFLFAGNMVEGMSSYAFLNMPPPADDAVFTNNLATYPWGTISEVGVPGAYYEFGRMPGTATVAPWGSSSGGNVAGFLSVRNVFCGGVGLGSAPSTVDNLVGTSYGSPGSFPTSVPANVTGDWNNPTLTSQYTSIADIEEFWTPSPDSQLRNQGTVEIFGPFGTGMINFRLQTFDAVRLRAYA